MIFSYPIYSTHSPVSKQTPKSAVDKREEILMNLLIAVRFNLLLHWPAWTRDKNSLAKQMTRFSADAKVAQHAQRNKIAHSCWKLFRLEREDTKKWQNEIWPNAFAAHSRKPLFFARTSLPSDACMREEGQF